MKNKYEMYIQQLLEEQDKIKIDIQILLKLLKEYV